MPLYAPLPCRASKAVIQSAAERYAERIGFTPGASLDDVVEALGGRIVYRDFFLDRSAESIHVRSANEFEIFVPHETSPARDRFTIAHELGHLLLHYPIVRQRHQTDLTVEMKADRYLSRDATEEEQRSEWEANWFSAAFLMPSTPFIEAWKNSSESLEAVARRFLVSTSAARNRVDSLKKMGRL